MKRAIFILTALVIGFLNSHAEDDLKEFYDFMVDGIYYEILSEEDHTVGVIDPMFRGGWDSGIYCGNMIVPPTVEYDGNTYRVTSFLECWWNHVKKISLPSTIEDVSIGAISHLLDLEYLGFGEGPRRLEGPSFCENLRVLNLPDSLETIGEKSLVQVGIETLWIPQTVREIEDCCVLENENLRFVMFDNEVSYGNIIKSKLETIGNCCFSYNPNLLTAELPNTLTYMGECCFNDCPSLKTVYLPARDLDLNDCFNGCPSITYIMVNADEPYPFPESCFMDVDRSKCSLVVPVGSEELYMKAEGWKDFFRVMGSETLGVKAPTVSRVSDGQAYNLDGTPKPDGEKGIAIQDGKVIMRK